MLVSMDLTIPRDAGFVRVMREVAREILTQLRAPESHIADVQLAVTEACANAVRHAVGTQEYRIRLEVDQTSCFVEVIDIGPGFGALPGEGPADMIGTEDESGRGLHLMRALVDDLEFSRTGEANSVRLLKRWDGFSHA